MNKTFQDTLKNAPNFLGISKQEILINLKHLKKLLLLQKMDKKIMKHIHY